MRSRSHRLFVILFHLIVFHIPQNNHHHTAGMIIGVHPSPISLESIQLDNETGLVGFMNKMMLSKANLLAEPFWIQDGVDGKCLGPSGSFSECGDATLWFIRARRDEVRDGGIILNVITKGLQRIARLFSGGESAIINKDEVINWKFALQLSNQDMSSPNIPEETNEKAECLVVLKNRKNSNYTFRLRSCQKESAWNWNVNGAGYLMSLGKQNVCVWRNKSAATKVAPCNDNGPYRKVAFSLVRLQQVIPSPVPSIDSHPIEPKQHKKPQAEEPKGNVPHTMTASESHAHASLHHLELLPMNSVRIPSDAATILKAGNPLLFPSKDTKPLKPSLSKRDIIPRKSITSFIKIPSHPYITESKGTGIWTDPSTDLQYPTDLVSFLGNDRKTHGRHTLMGVGQYTRTVFKVKIYGVAFYVSKRDVLADAEFSKYAMMSREELQENQDFYKYLYSAPGDGGSFDRTLMIKLNMQLGVETIRTCLQSEWKYLTEEHKEMLIGSSLKKRQADDEMLNIIKEKDNTQNCSCSQIAPEEYEADTTCCARGTEMVFTWRKDGALELRVNKRFIDSFPSEIAQGIFYEYLRVDDPMSEEARLNFATGFPFLLAPLAQVKGVGFGAKNNNIDFWHTNDDSQDDPKTKSKKTNPFLMDIGHTIIKHGKNALIGSVSTVCHVAQTGLGTVQEAGNQVARMLTGGKHQQNTQLTIFTPLKEQVSTSDSLHAPFSSFDAPYIDEIAVNMPPTNSFTHKLFSYAVHLYLLLLLVISIPESYNIKTIKMVASKQKLPPKNKDKNTNITTATSPIPIKVRTSFSRNTSFRDSLSIMPIIDEVEEEEEKADGGGLFYDDPTPNEKSNIKKSLSYFL